MQIETIAVLGVLLGTKAKSFQKIQMNIRKDTRIEKNRGQGINHKKTQTELK